MNIDQAREYLKKQHNPEFHNYIDKHLAGDFAVALAENHEKNSTGSAKKIIKKGEVLETKEYGLVMFKGFDYFMGQKTAKLYSDEYSQTFYPLPEKIEEQGYTLFDG